MSLIKTINHRIRPTRFFAIVCSDISQQESLSLTLKVNVDMKRILLSIVTIMLTVCSATSAEDKRPGTVTIEKRSVSYEAALRVAQEAMATAKKSNTDVAVVVVDSAGIPLVLLRADNATEQFVTGATRKAWTSANLRNSTALSWRISSRVKKISASSPTFAMPSF